MEANIEFASDGDKSIPLVVDECETHESSSCSVARTACVEVQSACQDVQYQDVTGTSRTLSAIHLTALEARGITQAMARSCGLYSEKNIEAISRILNSKVLRIPNLPALVIPFGGGGFARVRPDNPRKAKDKDKPVKYESPKGSTQQLYVPPCITGCLQDPLQELIFTEGEFKAIAATQEGFPTIGLVGVWGWKVTKQEKLLPEFKVFKLPLRKVYIAFDSDKARNPDVLLAQNRFAQALAVAGAIVRIVNIRDGPDDSKQGLDDFLKANWGEHKKLFRELLDDATVPETTEEENESASNIDPAISTLRQRLRNFFAHERCMACPRFGTTKNVTNDGTTVAMRKSRREKFGPNSFSN